MCTTWMHDSVPPVVTTVPPAGMLPRVRHSSVITDPPFDTIALDKLLSRLSWSLVGSIIAIVCSSVRSSNATSKETLLILVETVDV